MGYSGYTQAVCKNGHYTETDYLDDDEKCVDCQEEFMWSHHVNMTNGDEIRINIESDFVVQPAKFEVCNLGYGHHTTKAIYRAPTKQEYDRLVKPKLDIQEFFRNGGTREQLLGQYSIAAKEHKKYPNLVLFKYNQIASDFSKNIVQECRGIILDENDDWKVVSYPFKKFFNYEEELSNSSQLHWDRARVYEKLDGCFLYKAEISLWGVGKRNVTIGKIVNHGARPTLIGMDKSGNLVPSYITNVKKNGTKDNWLKIVIRNGNITNNLIVTDNHHIFVNDKFIAASDIRVGDILKRHNVSPDSNTLHMIKSSLLGDGSLLNGNSPNISTKYSESHVEKHQNYIDHIEHWLGEFGIKTRNIRSGYGSKMKQVSSRHSISLNKLREEWYPKSNNNIKCIPQNLEWIDDFTVAKWYMDDGSLAHSESQQDRACFATNGFSETDVGRLAGVLEARYNVDVNVYFSKGWCLRINAGRDCSIENFWTAIAPHIVECMRYKLPEKYRNVPYFERPRGTLQYETIDLIVESVEKLENTKKNFPYGRVGYDIETTTGNYFANGVLVHNSLMTAFPYNGEWHFASSGTPDASGQVNGMDFTFEQLFKQCLGDNELPDASTCRMCFMFEMTSKYNRVVVQYDEPSITLIGARCLDSYEEMEACVAWEMYFPKANFGYVKSFPIGNLTDLIAARDQLNPRQQEGFIVWDLDTRVKVKNLEYIKLHHMKDSLQSSPRALMRVVMAGEVSEVVIALPEFTEELTRLEKKYNTLISTVEKDYEEIRHIESQKDFALEAKKKLVSSPLFAIRNKKANSVKEFLSQIQVDTVLELCGKL